MATSVRTWSDRFFERRPHLLRTAAIVLATLGLAYFLGRQPHVRYVQIPLLLLTLWLVFHRPHLGILAVLISASVLPFTIGTGTQTSLHLAFVLIPALTALWLARMLITRSFRLAPSRTNVPALGLALATTLAFLYGNLPLVEFAQHAPLRSQIGGWAIIVFSVAAFLLVANQIKEARWLKVMAGIFLGFGAVYFLSHTVPGAGRVSRIFPIGATDSMFWLWVVSLAGSQAIFNTRLAPGLRVLLGLQVLLVMGFAYSPVQFDWASGWLPCTVVLLVLVFLRWPRLGLFLGVFGLLAAFLGFETLRAIALTEDNQYSLLTRAAAFQVVSDIIRANPLLGVGPANYFWYTPFYSLLGWYVRFNSHSQYVDLLAQVGFVGLGFYLWFVAAAAGVGWRLQRVFPGGFERAYAAAAVAALAGMLVSGALGDWVLPFVYNVGVRGFRSSVIGWLFLGGLVSLEQIARRQNQDAEHVPAGT